jgi:hypothetical protein
MNKTLDVFDYLKVADKEDIYTALLYYAFLESELFRSRFCAFFGAKVDPKTKLLLRHPFVYETQIASRKISKDQKIIEASHRHQRQIPDLTLITQDKICIIESKLFSNEGSYQTQRYGDKDFLASIKNDKSVKAYVLESTKLSPQLSSKRVDQCLFYMTINGDKALNPNFLSITWSELILAILPDFHEQNEILQPVLKQMAHRFISYPSIKSDIIALKENQSCDQFLRNKSKHFLLSKETLFLAYFDDFIPVKKSLGKGGNLQVDLSSLGGVQQITLSCDLWGSESLDLLLSKHQLNEPVSTFLDEIKEIAYPFAQLKIKIVNNKKIAVCLTYESNPYLSETKFLMKYGSKLLERHQQGKKAFEEALRSQGHMPSSTTLQVTKTEFLKKDKDLIEKVTAQVMNYVSLIQTLILNK